MTGDGAVVRVDHEAAKRIAGIILAASEAVKSADDPSGVQNLARAYLAQAAEIERLTVHLTASQHEAARIMETIYRLQDRAEASEARTADLLKALRSHVICETYIAADRIPQDNDPGGSCLHCGGAWPAGGGETHKANCIAAAKETV